MVFVEPSDDKWIESFFRTSLDLLRGTIVMSSMSEFGEWAGVSLSLDIYLLCKILLKKYVFFLNSGIIMEFDLSACVCVFSFLVGGNK